MVLARILTPRDFGLIAMVAAVTRFILVFKDLGLSMATVQKAEINHGQISTLFWINIAISSALMLLTMALAPGVAWFYKEPRLAWVTLALASAFIFGGLTVQHQALLRRQMRFVTLATIDISSMAAGVATGVICGLAGLGYWSLVLMQLVTPITMAAGVWIASGWRPGPPVRRSGVREMLAFGGYLTGFSVVNYFARNLDKILLGRFWGSQSVGIYTKAYFLLLLPLSQVTAPITAVVVPALSRLQNEPKRYRNYYLKAIKLIAYITAPLEAAIGIHQLKRVERYWKRRNEIWERYNEAFADLPVGPPADPKPETRHAHHLYTLMIDKEKTGVSRDGFLDAMTARNIGIGVHYLSIPEHPFYQQTFGWRPEDYPNAMRIGRQTVSLPLSAKLTDEDLKDVSEATRRSLQF